MVIYVITYKIRFGGTGGGYKLHMALLGMSYFQLLVGTYFYKYCLMDKIEKLYKKLVPDIIQIPGLVLLVVITIIFKRYVATLIIAPITGLIFIVSYILITRKYTRLGVPFDFLGKHSTNIWLIHMFFYLDTYGGLVFVAKYSIPVLILLLVICVIASYIINGLYNLLLSFYEK